MTAAQSEQLPSIKEGGGRIITRVMYGLPGFLTGSLSRTAVSKPWERSERAHSYQIYLEDRHLL